MLWQVPIAYGMDLIFGDPVWFPHQAHFILWANQLPSVELLAHQGWSPDQLPLTLYEAKQSLRQLSDHP